jgi:hypothetical protein
MVQAFRPDVVVLVPTSRMNRDRCLHVVDCMTPFGWRQTQADCLPPGCGDVLVLTQRRGDLRTARRRARDEG